MSTTKLREDAMTIFRAGLAAVDPKTAVRRALSRDGEMLSCAGESYNLADFEDVVVIGAGKAGAPMAAAVEEILDRWLTTGVVNVKYGHLDKLKSIRINEAGHPLPDQAGVRGAREIVRLAELAGEKDLLICVISGGGSALLPLPVAGVTLEEKQALTEKLLACGASINEINAVRKHISQVKGGQLARLASPATQITLILSDVIGDPLEVIASGPTAPDSSTFADVYEILQRYQIWDGLADSIRQRIQAGRDGEIADTPDAGDPAFFRTLNVVVANNRQAMAAAVEKAKGLGYNALVLSSCIEGETREVARVHAAIAREIVDSGNPLAPPACVISGGETTVTLRGDGKGGRNQEFVLAAALDIAGLQNVVILSAGTDGTDGPTDAAGAICDGETCERAGLAGLDPVCHLENNDAYPLFKELGHLIVTGPTNTNVMDLRIILAGDAG